MDPVRGDEGPAIEVDRLGHRYSDREALSEVSMSVERGEIVGIVGPNGGGKTTLFRILATLLRPSSGAARVFGCSVTADPRGVRGRLGVVFQNPSLDDKLTVRENILHHGHLHGLMGRELSERIRSVVASLGLMERIDERVDRLSGGLRRRAELAKALLHRPPVLLLDEPNTGLDPNARREYLNQLDDLRHRDGTTVFLTTHFMEEAERCDRVGFLHEGRLVALDTPQRLKGSIGGDVVVIRGNEPARMLEAVRERFGGAAALVDGTVRIEHPEGHRLVDGLAEAFPGEIRSVTWGQPTLDDVFVHLTGQRFDGAAA